MIAGILTLPGLPAHGAADDGPLAPGDTLVSADVRSYFFRRDFKGATRDREDPALGGILRLRTKPATDLTLGLSLYLSNDLGLADDGKDVYSLLGRDEEGRHRSYSVLGEGYLSYRWHGTRLSFGRQEMTTPWVNLHDVRMTPQSFEALVLTHDGFPATSLTLAHVPRMKKKNETRFRAMSDIAAGSGDEPVTLVGLVHSGIPGTRLQLWDYLAHEMWNDIYLRLDWKRKGERGPVLRAGIRYLRRRSLGRALAGPLDTYHAGISCGLESGGFSSHLAWSRNGDQGIVRAWGHDMTISNQVYVADRARESAWLVATDYRFDGLGLPGLAAGVLYSLADTPDSGTNASPDRGELNLDLKYEFPAVLDGLSLRARYAVVNEWGTATAENVRDTRLQLRYRRDL